ncbi:MAG: hypothetical protein ACYTBZ_13040 [Planctomycetota bacterium]|jgi:hypothetical protein
MTKTLNTVGTLLLLIFGVCELSYGGTYEQTKELYKYSAGGTINWMHTYDHSADPVASVTLTIVADDVDGPGNGLNGEQDKVYINGHYVGLLNDMGYYTNWGYHPGPGNPHQPLTTTVFDMDPSWLDGVPIVVDIETLWGAEIETSTLTVISAVIPLDLDILPSDCPNLFTVNMQGKGRLPMAILGTEDFDVSDIDPGSISIADVVFPKKTPSIEDESAPVGEDECACQVGTDGIDDLVVHFSRHDLIVALGLEAMVPGTEVPITVTGELLDGTPFEATDCVTLEARED